MAKKKIIIAGAGLAGLSAAWHLQNKGIECKVFEKEPCVGGLCRSKNVLGYTFDYSGHLLHFRHPHTFDFLNRIAGTGLQRHSRSAWVYVHNRFTPYPFQANFYGLPVGIVKECLIGFLKTNARKKPLKNEQLNFFEWIMSTFGKGIARHFMVPYNAKFWTVPLRELTCDWLDGFIPTPSLEEVIDGTIKPSRKQFGYNTHFWYPLQGGIGVLPEALGSRVRHLYVASAIVSIDLKRKTIALADGNQERFDSLISTIPLPDMARLLKGITLDVESAFKKLRWNSIFNVNLGVKKSGSDGRHWVYYPQKEFSFYRVGFFHNFSSSNVPAGKASLYAEVSYSKDKPLDKKAIVCRIQSDLQRAGVLAKGQKIEVCDVNDISYGYPLYDRHYESARNTITQFLVKNGITPCGRYGSWRYMSMEDVLIDGSNAALEVARHV